MKKDHRRSRRRTHTIQPWTYQQALGAVPYIRSIMTSLREHRLEASHHQLRARRLAQQPGRPDRSAIIAREEARKQAEVAADRFQEALEELGVLDVYCLDPVEGLALVPFAQDNDLAWFVFDLHDPVPFRYWRYHKDPLETRRPLADSLENLSGNSEVA
jgi:hypothetical protein